MNLPQEVLRILRCPACGAALSALDTGLACLGSPVHDFPLEEGFLTFAKPPIGKYDPGYAARYAALWAFGYQTLHSGLDEPLYRSVSSLVAEVLAAQRNGNPKTIVDCGCGVGRVAADCAALLPDGVVVGFDASLAMLELAEKVVLGREPVDVDLSAYGFGTLAIPARARENVYLFRADVESLPVANGSAGIALSVNIIDRLPHGPELAFAECYRILRPGGHLIFTDPLNWTELPSDATRARVLRMWKDYGKGEAILHLLEALGFRIETWFDALAYREILDGRGSFEEFRTLVVLARKDG